jgi:hypothetical protein
MNRNKKRIGVVLCLAAIVCFAAAWPVYKWFRVKGVSTSLFERTRALVEKKPQLRPVWDNAMRDGVLTWAEAKDIWEQAGEKVEPEE